MCVSKKRLSSIAGAVAFGGTAYAQGYTIDGVEYQSVSETQAYELDPETGNALVTMDGETVLVEQGDYIVVDEQILFTSEAVSVLASASGVGLLGLLILSSQDANGNVQQGGNPPPPPIPNSPPLITSPSNPSTNENLNEVFTPTLSDAEQDPLTLSIAGGADAALFSVSNNTYFFTATPDYENPLDADSDNVYELELEVSDGNGGTGTQSVSVSVLNTNDNDPVFSSGSVASLSENTTDTGYSALATDGDGDAVTYSSWGGVDQRFFNIDPVTGTLSFDTAPDFEIASDDDGDNVYEVDIQAIDGNGGSSVQRVYVTVQDVGLTQSFGDGYAVAGLTVNVDGTNDDDSLTFGTNAADSGSLTIDLMSGADTLTFGADAAHAGNITVNGAAGDKILNTGAQAGFDSGVFSVNLGDGDHTLNFGDGSGGYGGTVDVTLGDGNSTIAFGDYSGNNGTINVTVGDGNNSLIISDFSVRSGTFTYTSGTGASNIQIGDRNTGMNPGTTNLYLGADQSDDQIVILGEISHIYVHDFEPLYDSKIVQRHDPTAWSVHDDGSDIFVKYNSEIIWFVGHTGGSMDPLDWLQ